MDFVNIVVQVFLILDYLLRVVLATRIILRRMPVGASLAWLAVVMAFPFMGVIIYLLVGELRLGNRRARWANTIHKPFERWLSHLRKRINVDWDQYSGISLSLSRLAESGVAIPAMQGNQLELLCDADTTFESIVADIDKAERTCHLEFYIWQTGGKADDVCDALVRASKRGVICRLLVDSVGSRSFLRSSSLVKLREQGVDVRQALPASIFRMWFVRFDLRLHRKIVVIDGEIAYTGSMNLVDPRIFKQSAGVGQWVDAMARVTGPSVEGLAITFLEDWALETNDSIEELTQTGDVHALSDVGQSVVHVVPSGPAIRRSAMDRVLITAIYEARHELIITTPYFVPDDSLLTALVSAARRGVRVVLIVPERIDSMLVRLASEAYHEELLEAGVEIQRFRTGLLHTKSVTIDNEVSLFGSVNLDPRSLHLNFEITLLVHCRDFCARLRELQQDYLNDSEALLMESIKARSIAGRMAVNIARLAGPLL